MYAIDLLQMRHDTETYLGNTVVSAVDFVASVGTIEVYGVVAGVVVLLLLNEWYRRWRKGKGLRMAVEHERQRIREILSEGLTDMILDWEVKGKISHQEGDQLYNELSKKLDLPDLIPRQRRIKIVKNQIKSRLRSPKHEVKKPNIPGDKPMAVSLKKFHQRTGSLLSRFWK